MLLQATTDSGIANARIGQAIRVARNTVATPAADRRTMPAPQAPQMNGGRFLVGFLQDKNEPGLTDSQVAPSDQVDAQPLAAEQIQNAPEVAVPIMGQPALASSENIAWEPDYCNRDCRRLNCDLGCERKLFGTRDNGLNIGGWASLGYHNRDNIMLNNRKAEANLHQAWLYFDKPADGGLGYHMDMVYGIDGQDLQAFGNSPAGDPSGWDNSWDFAPDGWALPQAYVQFNRNCWDVKIGKFFSPFGYEVIPATDNFFYSHTYTMYYMEPFTMSGAIGERKIRENWSFILGATTGWDTAFQSSRGGFNLITGNRFRPNECVDIALTSSIGDTGLRDSGTLTSFVAKLRLTEDVRYVYQTDISDLGDSQEFSSIHYLFRDVSPCLGLGMRLEWWKSDQLFDNTKSTWDFTMGANYRPNANIVFRPELRFDWGAAAIDPGTPIVGIDAVMTF